SAPYSVAVADVSGDGRQDLVVANYGPTTGGTTVSVLLGNGNGTFQAKQDFITGLHPHSVAIADLNGDGKRDLAGATQNGVSVLLGNGTGTFKAAQNFTAGGRSVAIADVSGDSTPDLVVVNSGSNSVNILLGNGNGTFQAAQNFATGGFPQSVVVADLSRD